MLRPGISTTFAQEICLKFAPNGYARNEATGMRRLWNKGFSAAAPFSSGTLKEFNPVR
jgi:hypothetical protein